MKGTVERRRRTESEEAVATTIGCEQREAEMDERHEETRLEAEVRL